jgi:hypothetical protein
VALLAVETGVILIIVVLVTLPIAAFAFAAGAGRAFNSIGRGGLSLEDGPPPREVGGAASARIREEEVRQMVEARSYRAVARGGAPLDVDAEVASLLAAGSTGPGVGSDEALREEVRQLVVARNERRARQGKEPLDVEREIERQLRELEGLGQ